jgi:hypothetical protein
MKRVIPRRAQDSEVAVALGRRRRRRLTRRLLLGLPLSAVPIADIIVHVLGPSSVTSYFLPVLIAGIMATFCLVLIGVPIWEAFTARPPAAPVPRVDAAFANPRLAEVCDVVNGERHDLDAYVGIVVELGARRRVRDGRALLPARRRWAPRHGRRSGTRVA